MLAVLVIVPHDILNGLDKLFIQNCSGRGLTVIFSGFPRTSQSKGIFSSKSSVIADGRFMDPRQLHGVPRALNPARGGHNQGISKHHHNPVKSVSRAYQMLEHPYSTAMPLRPEPPKAPELSRLRPSNRCRRVLLLVVFRPSSQGFIFRNLGTATHGLSTNSLVTRLASILVRELLADQPASASVKAKSELSPCRQKWYEDNSDIHHSTLLIPVFGRFREPGFE